MEEKDLDTALEIFSALIQGKTISADDRDTGSLYQAFYRNPEVYDITARLLKKLNLQLFEYENAFFITAGAGNRIFGYTNEDLKRKMGLRRNRELYLADVISCQALLAFYKSSGDYQIREYVRTEEIMQMVSDCLNPILQDGISGAAEAAGDNFRAVALLWDSLPQMLNDDMERNKASRGSRYGYVRLTMNFLEGEDLFRRVDDRYYPTGRLHAIAKNYFDENGSLIRKRLREAQAEGEE